MILLTSRLCAGMLATAAILDNYNRLVGGGQLDTEPLPPLPSIEQLTSKVITSANWSQLVLNSAITSAN